MRKDEREEGRERGKTRERKDEREEGRERGKTRERKDEREEGRDGEGKWEGGWRGRSVSKLELESESFSGRVEPKIT